MSAAHNLHRQVKQLTDQGVRAIIPKPFDLQTVVAAVQRYAPIPA